MMSPVETLAELFFCRHNSKEKITIIKGSNEELHLSYSSIFSKASGVLYALQSNGVKAGDKIILQHAAPDEFIIYFWACILGGIIPVPLKTANTDEDIEKTISVFESLDHAYIILPSAVREKLLTYIEQQDKIASCCLEENIFENITGEGELYHAQKDDIAYIQFSSGSTRSPKGILLTHHNLITNIKAILNNIASPPTGDIFFSWMPLSHDMGLIGYHLTPVYAGWSHYIMPTELFIRHPALWLQKMSEHKATFTASPNFGYKYVMNYLQRKERMPDIDLSHVRIITNGAEPISASVCKDFQTFMEKYNLPANVIFPVYGLAEACLAVTFSNPGAPVQTITLNRNTGEIVNHEDGVTFVNVGRPLNDNCKVRIVLKDGELADEGIPGHVQISGANVTAGYVSGDTTSFDGEWFDTGDLGLFSDNCLYITGRAKDIIFHNGLNIYPHDVENAIEQQGLVEAGKIAIAGCFNDREGREDIIAFIVHKGNLSAFPALISKVKEFVNVRYQIRLDKVFPVSKIPKTTSGKFQRFKLIALYQQGGLSDVEQINEIILPETQTEATLLEICRESLQVPSFSVLQNLFELGINSLNAAQIQVRIQEQFGVKLQLKQILLYPTIRKLAAVILTLPDNQHTVPAITPAVQKYYPLSAAQKGIYFFQQLNKTSVAYNIPLAYKITGKVDMVRLEQAIVKLIARHEVLRTSFEYHNETPVQVISDTTDFKLAVHNTESDDLVQPFDLQHGPLFRIRLLQLQEYYILFTDFHHIIFDGYSYMLFFRELTALYDGLDLLPLSMQYKEFATWENNRTLSDTTVAFWKDKLQGNLPVLQLQSDHARPAMISYEGRKMRFILDASLSKAIRKLASEKGVTLYVFFLAAYNVLLSKYAGQEDVVVGVPVTVRKFSGLEHLFGMFVNNLIVQNSVKEDSAFSSFLQSVSDRFIDILDNSTYPFYDMISDVGLKADNSHHTAFDVQLVFHNFGESSFGNSDFSAERYFLDPGIAKYDLTFELFDEGDNFHCHIEFATAIFERESIEAMYNSFIVLLQNITLAPDIQIQNLSLLTGAQQNEYLPDYNDTATPYPALETLHSLIDKKSCEIPEHTAVMDEERILTYHELGVFSDRLATWLSGNGAAEDVPVAIALDRSIEFVIAVMGVLKSGSCFLPVDTTLPLERINYLLTDSRATILITSSAWYEQYKSQLTETVVLLLDSPACIPASVPRSVPVTKPESLAYIIYTSGSTGKPKGVMIEHRSAVNYISWAADVYVDNKPATYPLYTSVSFDLTITSLFMPLITGGTIIIFHEDNAAILINKVVADERVQIVKATPSHLRILKEHPLAHSGVKVFIVGGEAFPGSLAHDIHTLFRGIADIYNEYGPTEATVGCMIYKYNPDEKECLSVPIGKPAANTCIYLLDGNLRPVPVNVRGEIYISGTGLARGYLHNQELTADKFVQHAFAANERMYKTGDTAIRNVQGALCFIGRRDTQVKINGYRIEIAEIESVLMETGEIDAAVVIVRKGALYAYYTTPDRIALPDNVIKQRLLHALPAYMQPALCIWLDTMPLTVNGKVDAGSLPEPVRIVHTADDDECGNTGLMVKGIWQDVLQLTDVHLDDKFFEIGGDSIKAVQISSRLLTYGFSLNARDILQYQSIREILNAGKVSLSGDSYQQDLLKGIKLLSPIENWFLEQQFVSPEYFTQSVLLQWNGRVNKQVLEKCLKAIVIHHDGLRLNYNSAEHGLFFSEEIPDHVAADEYDGEDLAGYCVKLRQRIDITSGHLLRAAIINEEGYDLLFLTVHHLGIDGYSWRILLEDLRTLYLSETYRLPAKTASLRDWSLYLDTWAHSSGISAQKGYWKALDELSVSGTLPAQGTPGSYHIKLDRDKTDFLLHDAVRLYRHNVQTLLLAALSLSLEQLTSGDTLVIELEHHGRTRPGIDVSRTLGWFTSIYPFMLTKAAGPEAAISSVRAALDAVPDDGAGYGVLRYQGKPGKKRCMLRFNYLGSFDQEINTELFSLSDRDTGADTAMENGTTADLEMDLLVTGGTLNVRLKYNNAVYKEHTIIAFANTWLSGLTEVLSFISLNQENVRFIPDDFDTLQLSQEELDTLFV